MKSASAPFQVALKLVLKWWWLILISIALGVGVGAFIRSRQPDVFYARSTIWFGQNIGTALQDPSGFSAIQDLMSIYAGLTTRDRILQPVIDKMNLGITVEDLTKRISATPDRNLPLLEIWVADTDAVRAADIANALAQEVITQSPTEKVSQETEFKRQQLRKLETQITELQDKYNSLLSVGATLTSAVDIALNLEEQTSTQKTLQDVQKLYADLSATLNDPSGSLQIYDVATAQNAMRITGSMASVILSGAAGLVISLATIVLIAFFDDRLQWQEGLDEVEGVKVLGPLGIVPRAKLPLYMITMPDAIESEVLRQLRAKIVLAAGGKHPRVMTMCSYDSGDGKTVTASNLSLAWAQSGLRTLLVDGDIRKGNLHELFRLPNVMGLSDILAGRDDVSLLLSRSILDSGYENLAILPCGRATGDPASLLSGPRLQTLVDILKKQFDIVVFDAVPAIGGPDTAFLAEKSDGVLIVVHAQRTTASGLRRVLQMFQQSGRANVFGVVFNRLPLQVTSGYNRPYYRRQLAISPEHLSREIVASGVKGARFRLNANVNVDKDGNRLYSLVAAAVQLGVSSDTLNDWVKTGYLKVERHGRRQWVRESEIMQLLERLPRQTVSNMAGLPASSSAPPSAGTVTAELPPKVKKPSSGRIPDLLRGQRDALLAAARDTGVKDEDTE